MIKQQTLRSITIRPCTFHTPARRRVYTHRHAIPSPPLIIIIIIIIIIPLAMYRDLSRKLVSKQKIHSTYSDVAYVKTATTIETMPLVKPQQQKKKKRKRKKRQQQLRYGPIGLIPCHRYPFLPIWQMNSWWRTMQVRIRV